MAGPNRTQKEIAQSYRGNLGYLRKFNFFRTLRGATFLVVVLGSLAVAFGYRHFHHQEFFSTGPITSNHVKFADRCEVCHNGADPDLIKALHVPGTAAEAQETLSNLIREAKLAAIDETAPQPDENAPDATAADATPGVIPISQTRTRATLHSPQDTLKLMGSLKQYDEACIKCHPAYQLHQPAATALLLQNYYNEIGLVHAGSCSTCHKEHDGPGRMKLPPSNNCRSCHNDIQQLTQGLTLLKNAARQASPRGEVRTFTGGAKTAAVQGDGVRRFIPPRAVPHQPVAFDTFAGKHPDFGYEQPNLIDPAKIKYGHLRHSQQDVYALNNQQPIACIQCHKLGPDGLFMQRVSYANDCERCHSLNFDPEVPELRIPHGRPDDVRTFLNGLGGNYLATLRRTGRVPEDQLMTVIRARLDAMTKDLKPIIDSGFNPAVAMERRIFYEDILPGTQRVQRITSKSNNNQPFPSCIKCHDSMVQVAPGVLPVVPAPNIADRWLTRGPFTHAPHLHMQCVDCHAKALASDSTSDILLPPKSLCASCHRPLQQKPTGEAVAVLPMAEKNAELVKQQRAEGGIAFECQTCHGKFHAPAGASVFARVVK